MLSYLNPLPTLPQYRGPHRVGTCEFEIPITEITSSSIPPSEKITTLKFRLYYPTTRDAISKASAYWLPEPQQEWNDAYSSFMGASGRVSPIISRMLGMWNYTALPAVRDAPLAKPESSTAHPVCVFSHGLGGNSNTYSSICGSLASCGVFCLAPEHRDGSAPISFVQNAKGEVATTIPYQKLAHSPTRQVLNARNAQLRIRCWELELAYAVLKGMNEGKIYTNFASSEPYQLHVKDQLNLGAGQVTWAGHSFGAATTTQFVKSVYYHQYLPETVSLDTNDASTEGEPWDTKPLLKCAIESDLVKQITPSSPVALLDLWTMPLRGETTKWLWERPMPSYHRTAHPEAPVAPSTVAVISAEFYKWTELLNRTRAALSGNPVAAIQALDSKRDTNGSRTPDLSADRTRSENPIPELNKQETEAASTSALSDTTPESPESSRTPSPAPSHSGRDSAASSQTSLVPSEPDADTGLSTSSLEPHLYLVPQSAHLSQSDFGVLFPNLTKYAMKAIEPEKTLELNIRAVLGIMKGAGLPVAGLVEGDDHILQAEKMDKKERWVRVPLVDA